MSQKLMSTLVYHVKCIRTSLESGKVHVPVNVKISTLFKARYFLSSNHCNIILFRSNSRNIASVLNVIILSSQEDKIMIIFHNRVGKRLEYANRTIVAILLSDVRLSILVAICVIHPPRNQQGCLYE